MTLPLPKRVCSIVAPIVRFPRSDFCLEAIFNAADDAADGVAVDVEDDAADDVVGADEIRRKFDGTETPPLWEEAE